MAFNFPDGASNGDTHTASNGVVYRFDGTVWVVDRPSNTTSFDSKYLNTTGDGIVSSSAQITDGSGIISGSTHLFTAVTSSGDISGSGTGSFGVINVGGGIFTSASLAAGGSGVSSYTDLTNVPEGIISGSGQLPSGIISGSTQLPSGLISGSTQISESGFVSSSTTNIIEVMTSASYATITPVTGTLYIIQG